MTRRVSIILVVIAAVALVLVVLALNCPSVGIALTSRARQLHRLKNRTVLPQAGDFDARVTLDALLQPGEDSSRWSNERAARIQGEVLDVAYARPEATNCFNPCRRDIHIVVATHKDAGEIEQVILEVTPNLRDQDEAKLQSQLVGHWVEFEGWLYFDVGHAQESENTAPGREDNWRGTAWEIHPVTKITVIR